MAETSDFRIITFEELKQLQLSEGSDMKEAYEPQWDQTRGVIRMSAGCGDNLHAERGNFIKVTHNNKTAIYTLKTSPFLVGNTIALDYDQQDRLGIIQENRKPAPLTIKKHGGYFGTFSYLWKHVDTAIRLPFKISIWLAIIGVFLGALLGFLLENYFGR